MEFAWLEIKKGLNFHLSLTLSKQNGGVILGDSQFTDNVDWRWLDDDKWKLTSIDEWKGDIGLWSLWRTKTSPDKGHCLSSVMFYHQHIAKINIELYRLFILILNDIMFDRHWCMYQYNIHTSIPLHSKVNKTKLCRPSKQNQTLQTKKLTVTHRSSQNTL